MFVIEMQCRLKCNKELTAVGIFALVGHADNPRLVVRNMERFVGKGLSLARCGVPPRAIEILKIATLDHKLRDNAMKNTASIGR